jgi:hypothetical protein
MRGIRYQISVVCLGRNRTLLGTKLISLRIVPSLIRAIDETAEEEGLSRNTVIARILADQVLSEELSKRKRRSGQVQKV